MIDLLMPTIAQGLLWAIMALGVYITYRVLDIADLTVEGSFPLGAAVAASLLAGGYSPWMAFGAAMLAGMLAGVATGLLHTKLKIPALLAGILTMIALYSVNLRVMGKANLSLLRVDTVFSIMRDIGGFSNAQAVLCVGIVSSLLIGGLIFWFFGTEIGAAIRATGFNPQMIRAQGVDTNFTIILGLLISNALVALSGALVAQNNGFADVGMGTGTIVIGLASVIIGEVLFGKFASKRKLAFAFTLASVILGAVIYYMVYQFVLWLKMPSEDMKLFSAIVVAIFLAIPYLKEKRTLRKGASK